MRSIGDCANQRRWLPVQVELSRVFCPLQNAFEIRGHQSEEALQHYKGYSKEVYQGKQRLKVTLLIYSRIPKVTAPVTDFAGKRGCYFRQAVVFG